MQPNRAEALPPAQPVLDAKVASAQAVLRDALATHPGRIALVSSFGADAVVLLHLAAQIDPDVPVIFVDTGRHFPETLAYVDDIERLLHLSDLRRVGPTPDEVANRDPENLRASYDPDGCCAFRKVLPLERGLEGLDAWISGRKRFQASSREEIAYVEHADGRVKYNPLADWTSVDIEQYRRTHDLPRHPLVAKGYLSIGCAPCTTPVQPGEDPRAGRWRDFAKTECGIHVGASTVDSKS